MHVYVMLLEAGGSDLATAIAAASVALADAGISMYDLVPACLVVSAAGRLRWGRFPIRLVVSAAGRSMLGANPSRAKTLFNKKPFNCGTGSTLLPNPILFLSQSDWGGDLHPVSLHPTPSGGPDRISPPLRSKCPAPT